MSRSFASGCVQWTAFDRAVPVPSSAGHAVVALPIPVDTGLLGREPAFQFVCCDAAAGSPGLAMSAGTRVRIESPAPRLRVMSYNIHHGAGTDGRVDLERIAAVVRRQAPDLVALQEVDRNVPRSGDVDQATELGRLLDMHVVFGESIPLGDGSYGNALLSKVPLRDVRVVDLPNPLRREQRTMLTARVAGFGSGRPVWVVATHYDHAHQPTRSAGADATLRHVANLPGSVLVIGDLNARPGSPTLAKLRTAFDDAARAWPSPTSPAERPTRRIDYVLARTGSGLAAQAAWVPAEPVASDHRPVVVDLGWH